MRNIEDDIRELFEEEARSAPAPHETGTVIGRTRRRQGTVIAGGVLAAIALVAAGIVGARTLGTIDRTVPADQPTVTTTINGISMSHPEGWYVVDPDEAGLNGPDPTPDLPKLVLAVAPFDPGELFACPGMTEGTPHTFLMTIQEEPLALAGDAASRWPVALQPMHVGSSDSGCYPNWEFLRAGWTAAGRTFEARIGFAPDVPAEDRDALHAAFASMTFKPVAGGSTAVVLATGTAGGEGWSLTASNEGDGLELSLHGESFGTGIGGFGDTDGFQMTGYVIEGGPERQRVVFGAVPADAVRLGLEVTGGEPEAIPAPEILDIPDAITSDLNAFVFSIGADQRAVVTAFDATEAEIASGEVGPGADT